MEPLYKDGSGVGPRISMDPPPPKRKPKKQKSPDRQITAVDGTRYTIIQGTIHNPAKSDIHGNRIRLKKKHRRAARRTFIAEMQTLRKANP